MLKCRICETSKIDCSLKRDVMKALNMIGQFVPRNTIYEIENIIAKNIGECKDFCPKIDDDDD